MQRGGKNPDNKKFAGSDTFADVAVENSQETYPVGNKRPNGLGLYDMTGNAAEWVSDWYASYQNTPGVQENPTGPEHSTGQKVIRGGGVALHYDYYYGRNQLYYYNHPSYSTVTSRRSLWPNNQDSYGRRTPNLVGFRVVLPSK